MFGVIVGTVNGGHVTTVFDLIGETQKGLAVSVCETVIVPPPGFQLTVTLLPFVGPMIVPFDTDQL
jgi:hypothetical protein